MSFFKSLISARQSKADQEVAKYLHRSEFKSESYDYILNMVVNGRTQELFK